MAWSTHRRSRFDQKPAAHHIHLLQHIQKVVDGELIHPDTGDKCSNLIFLLPPGSGKSKYLSVDSIPWVIQRKPRMPVLVCSHAADLIQGFSYEARDAIKEEYNILGYGLRADSQSVSEWDTTSGSTYRCRGVGAGLSGVRAYFAAIDDFLGKREDADSKLIRDKQWAWYWNDFFPRVIPGGVQVIVANRQHEDDLVGRLLEKQADQWVVVKLPFFAEENDPLKREIGAPLWPEWYDAKKVAEIKQLQIMEPRTYAGLFQQRPAPEEGNYFKKDMLRTYTQDEYDKLMRLNPRIYIGCDFAVSEEKDANRCAFIPVAVAPDGLLYVLPDVFWKQAGSEESTRAWLDLMKRRSPQVVWAEKGHISKSIGPFLKQMMIDEHTYAYIEEVTPVRAKDVRARSIQAMMSIGRVRFPSFASWWTAAEHEMLTFPGGKTDDFCLAGDTFVEMANGSFKLIRDIQEGEFVATNKGQAKVLRSVCTGVADTDRYYFDNGCYLDATGNHPVAVGEGEFVALDALTSSKTVLLSSRWRKIQSYLPKYWNTTATVIEDTQNTAVSPTKPSSQPALSSATPIANKEIGKTAKLVSKQPCYTQPVYNLLVEGDHTYFANGILTHNCDALAYIGLGLKSLIRASAPRPEEKEDLNAPFVPTVKWLKEQHKLNKPKEAAYQGR